MSTNNPFSIALHGCWAVKSPFSAAPEIPFPPLLSCPPLSSPALSCPPLTSPVLSSPLLPSPPLPSHTKNVQSGGLLSKLRDSLSWKPRQRCRWFAVTEEFVLWYKYRAPEALSSVFSSPDSHPKAFGSRCLAALPTSQILSFVYGGALHLSLDGAALHLSEDVVHSLTTRAEAQCANFCEVVLLVATAPQRCKAFRITCLNAADAQMFAAALEIAGVRSWHSRALRPALYRPVAAADQEVRAAPSLPVTLAPSIWSPSSVHVHLPYGLGGFTITPGILFHLPANSPTVSSEQSHANMRSFLACFPSQCVLPDEVKGPHSAAGDGRNFAIKAPVRLDTCALMMHQQSFTLNSFHSFLASDAIEAAVAVLRLCAELSVHGTSTPSAATTTDAWFVPVLRICFTETDDFAMWPPTITRMLLATNAGAMMLGRLPHIVLRDDANVPAEGARFSVDLAGSEETTPSASLGSKVNGGRRSLSRRRASSLLLHPADKEVLSDEAHHSQTHPLSIQLSTLRENEELFSLEAVWHCSMQPTLAKATIDTSDLLGARPGTISTSGVTATRLEPSEVALRQAAFSFGSGSHKCVCCRHSDKLPAPHVHMMLTYRDWVPSALLRLPRLVTERDGYGKLRHAHIVQVLAGDLAWEMPKVDSAWASLHLWACSLEQHFLTGACPESSILAQGTRRIDWASHQFAPWASIWSQPGLQMTRILHCPSVGALYRVHHSRAPWLPSPKEQDTEITIAPKRTPKKSSRKFVASSPKTGDILQQEGLTNFRNPLSLHGSDALKPGVSSDWKQAQTSRPLALRVDSPDWGTHASTNSSGHGLHAEKPAGLPPEVARSLVVAASIAATKLTTTTIDTDDAMLEVRRHKLERWLETISAVAAVTNEAPFLQWIGAMRQPTVPSSGRPMAAAPPKVANTTAAGRQPVPLSQVADYVCPGDIILFQCTNFASATQRFFSKCAYDHVGIVVDAAWMDANRPVAPPPATGVGHYAAKSFTTLDKSCSVSRFFGTEVRSPAALIVESSSVGLPAHDSDRTLDTCSLRSAKASVISSDPAISDLASNLSVGRGQLEAPVWCTGEPPAATGVPTAASLGRHTYNLHLLEATVEGVRAYPLQSRLQAYGAEYTKRIAIRRLLLPGEEWYEGEPEAWVPCSAACVGIKRPGAYTGAASRLNAHARAISSSLYPCPCGFVRARRIALERRLGYFLSQVQGMPYKLTMSKILFTTPAHSAMKSGHPPEHGSVTVGVQAGHKAPAAVRHKAGSTSGTSATRKLNRSYSIVALASPGTGAPLALASATPADRALVAAVPLARDYYCSELVATAYMRMGLLPCGPGRGATSQLGFSKSVMRPSTYWPNAWCEGGIVDAALPEGYYLDDEVQVDCSLSPMRHALQRAY